MSLNARLCISYLISIAKSTSYPAIKLATSENLSHVNMLFVVVRYNWKFTNVHQNIAEKIKCLLFYLSPTLNLGGIIT